VSSIYIDQGELDILPSDGTFSNLVLTSNLSLGKDLWIDGNAMVNGYLSVSTLYMGEGELDILPSDGTFSNLVLTSNLSLGKDLWIDGNAMVNGYLSVSTLYMGEGELDILPSDAGLSNLIITSNLSIGRNIWVRGEISVTYLHVDMLHASGQILDQDSLGINDTLYVPNIHGHLEDGLTLIRDVIVQDKLTVNDVAHFVDNVLISRALSVNNNAHFDSRVFLRNQLSIHDVSYLNSNLIVGGVLSVNESSYFSGPVYADQLYGDDLSLVNDARVEGDLFVGASVSVNSTAYLSDDLNIAQRLSLGGDAHMTSSLYAKGDLSIGTVGYFSSNVLLEGLLSVRREIHMLSNAFVMGKLSVSNEVVFKSDLEIHGELSLAREARLGSNLYLQGVLSANDRVFFAEELLVDANIVSSGSVSVGSTVVVNSTLSVGEIACFFDSIDAKSNAIIHEVLSVGSEAYFNDKVRVMGDLTVDNSVLLQTGLSVAGSTWIEGALRVRSNGVDVVCLSEEETVLNRLIVSNSTGPALRVLQNATSEPLMEIWGGETQHTWLNAEGHLGLGVSPSKRLHVGSGGALFDDDVDITNNLTVMDHLLVGKTANISGAVSVHDTVFLRSNLMVRGYLSVAEDVYSAGKSIVASDAVIGGELSVSSSAFMNSSMIVSGMISVQGGAYLNDSWLSGELTASDVSIRSELSVRGDAHLSSNLMVSKALSVKEDVFLDGKVLLKNHLSVVNDVFVEGRVVLGSDKVRISQTGINTTGSVHIQNQNATVAMTVEQLQPSQSILALKSSGGTQDFTVDAEGRVGIGRDNPTHKLHVTDGDVMFDSNLWVREQLCVESMVSIQGDVIIGGRLSIGGAQMIIQNQLSVNQLFAYEMVAETFTQISDEPNLQLNGLLRVEDSVYVRNSISCSEIFIDNDLILSSTLSLVAGQVIAADITTLNKLVIGDYNSPTTVLEQTHLSVHGSIDLYNLHANHIYADGGTIASAVTMESDLAVAGVLHALQIQQTAALEGPSPIADASVRFSNALASLVGKTGVFEENLYAKANLSVAGWCSVDGAVSSALMDTENAQIRSDLSVGANVYLNNLEVRTDLLLKHQLSLGSNLFMDDNLFVDGEVSVAGNIYPALIHQHIVPKADGSSVPDLNAFSDNQLSSLLTGGLRVDQVAKVDELVVNRTATFGSVLSVSSEVYLSSNIHVAGVLSVTESVFLKNELIVNNDVCFESTLSVIGGARIQGETDQIGDVRIRGQLSVEQSLDVKGVLRIDGGISVGSDALFASTVRLAGGLSVDSSVDFVAPVFAHGRLSVGSDTYAEDVFANSLRTSNLNVDRELWVAGGLSVEEHAFFSADLRAARLLGSALSVQSSVIEETLSVGGETELFTSRITGELFVMSNLYASKSLYVDNDLVGSTLSVASALVTSNMTVGSNLFVDQSCFVSGVLSVNQLFLGESDLTPELPQNAVFSNLHVGSNARVEGYLSVPILFADTIETPTPSDARYSNLIVNEEGVFLSNLRVDGTLLTNHIDGQGMLLSNGQLSVSALFVNDADLNPEMPSDPRFSNLFVKDNAWVQGDLSVSRLFADGFDVGVAFFEGAVSLESLIVQSNLSVGGDVSIEGFLSTGSNLQIGGVSLQEHHGQVELSATSISVTTAVYMGGVSIATEGGDTIALNGDTTVRGALDVQGNITQYGLTMSNYQIALEGFSNAIEHRLSRGFQQVFGQLATDEDFEDIAVGLDIGVRSNWWNNGSYMTLRDTVRDMSVLPINAITGEIDLGILASVDQVIPTSFDFDANINVTMQDHYGDDRGQMYGVMLHGNHPETANDYIRMNMLNPNNIAFKNKFKADFDLSTLDPEWRVFQDTVTLPSHTLHTQGTVLFNVLFCAYYAPNLAMNSGSVRLEMNDYLVPNTPTRRVNNYYEIMPDRTGYVLKEGSALYPRWTYRKWRNDMLGDIYYTKYKSAFGWGDVPNADYVYSHMASNGSLRELFDKTCAYILSGDAARKSISSDLMDQYFHTYITSFGSSSVVLGSNIHLNKLKHNIVDVSISPSRIPIEITRVVIPVIEWTQSLTEGTRYVYFTMATTGVAIDLFPIETIVIQLLFWSHEFTVSAITKSDDSASLSITTRNEPHQTSSGWYDRIYEITLSNVLNTNNALCQLQLQQLSDSPDYQIRNTEMVFANGTNYLNSSPDIISGSFVECAMREFVLQE
jgi:predicted acyltransferase (DUF342 family)